ncbi:MAG: diaminopimelate epimerase [Thermodesulfobacteriota bacterium]|nr:diaminopimelate epimerase [Thermodesulfobacteriota bacterium]
MNSLQRANVPFYKMQGSGNDFVLIDNRELELSVSYMPKWARRICARGFGVGADGLIFFDSPPKGSNLDYIWHFYNADGSRAEMCGNGSRCVAKFAFEMGFAKQDQVFGTDAGPVKAVVLPNSEGVKVRLSDPRDISLDLTLPGDNLPKSVHFVNVGVPHAVVLSQDALDVDVKNLGSALRNHEHFAPQGANVNFVQVRDRNHIFLRTYERGVEDETYACGTGAAASALITNALGLTGHEVEAVTSGGEILQIFIEDGTVFLQGKAVLVYSGEIYLESLGL